MKKILVISSFFYPHVGGSERYMEDLYVYLTQRNKDILVDVLCYNTNKAKPREKYNGLNIVRIPCWNVLPDQFSLPKPLPLIKYLLSHRDYNLVHSSTRFFDSSWWAPFFAKLTGAKVVLTDHCATHPVSDKWWTRAVIRIVEETIVRLIIRFYDRIFVENKKTKKFLKQTYGVNSVVAYPGIGLDSKKFDNKLHRNKLSVIFVGRLIESKGLMDLIDIANQMPDIKFKIVGDGPLNTNLSLAIRKSKLKNVDLLGNMPREKVMNLLTESDMFVYPSHHSEGLPISLVEAARAGLAVVTTDVGAISELIVNNKTGILVEPKDELRFRIALENLVRNKPLRIRLGKSLKKYVEKNFSWDKASNLILREL